MNQPLPKQTFEAALADLQTNDSFRVVLQAIREQRELLLGELGPCENPNQVMKLAGGIARIDELIVMLSPQVSV